MLQHHCRRAQHRSGGTWRTRQPVAGRPQNPLQIAAAAAQFRRPAWRRRCDAAVPGVPPLYLPLRRPHAHVYMVATGAACHSCATCATRSSGIHKRGSARGDGLSSRRHDGVELESLLLAPGSIVLVTLRKSSTAQPRPRFPCLATLLFNSLGRVRFCVPQVCASCRPLFLLASPALERGLRWLFMQPRALAGQTPHHPRYAVMWACASTATAAGCSHVLSRKISHLAWRCSDPTLAWAMQGKQGKQSKASKRSKKSKGKTGFRPRSKLRSAEADGNAGEKQQQTSRPLTEMQAPQGVTMAPAEETPVEPQEVKPSVADEAAFEDRLASLKADSSLLAKVTAAATHRLTCSSHRHRAAGAGPSNTDSL